MGLDWLGCGSDDFGVDECDGNVRFITFTNAPGPIRKILSHVGERVEPPQVSPGPGPPIESNELVKAHDDREGVQAPPDEFQVIDIRSL